MGGEGLVRDWVSQIQIMLIERNRTLLIRIRDSRCVSRCRMSAFNFSLVCVNSIRINNYIHIEIIVRDVVVHVVFFCLFVCHKFIDNIFIYIIVTLYL